MDCLFYGQKPCNHAKKESNEEASQATQKEAHTETRR
jgi:hypothetical protein